VAVAPELIVPDIHRVEAELRGARSSRVLVSASRRNGLCKRRTRKAHRSRLYVPPKSPLRRDAFASTRDERAPQNSARSKPYFSIFNNPGRAFGNR